MDTLVVAEQVDQHIHIVEIAVGYLWRVIHLYQLPTVAHQFSDGSLLFDGGGLPVVIHHVVPVEGCGGQRLHHTSVDCRVGRQLGSQLSLRPTVVVKHLAQRRGHATGDAQLPVDLRTESIVGVLGIKDIFTLIPAGGHEGRHVVVEVHRTSLHRPLAELGYLAGCRVEPPLHVGRNVVGLEAAFRRVAQYEVVANAVIAAHDDKPS